MYIQLSWRNIWRNKKRTIIAAASVFFAVLLAAVMRSGQLGSYSYMIHSSAKLYTGYLQVQGHGYWENRSIDKSIHLDETIKQEISEVPNIISINPRLETFALASFETSTKVAQVIGIDPQMENEMTGLKDKMVKGQYLSAGSDGALVAEGLAELLKVDIGDTITIIGQGYHGVTAAALIPVSGFIKMPFQDMNNALVFISLSNAQSIYAAEKRITSLSVMVDAARHLDKALTDLDRILENEYAVMTWDEMLPDLKQNIQLDNASGIIMMIILYIVIAFGVFGTVMMMISERAKEFGILIAVGMRKKRLVLVTTIETILVSFIGVAAGILGSLPVIFYLNANPLPITGDAAKTFDSLGIEPIFYFGTDPIIFYGQAVVILFIALATAFYPVLFIRRLKPVEAIHG